VVGPKGFQSALPKPKDHFFPPLRGRAAASSPCIDNDLTGVGLVIPPYTMFPFRRVLSLFRLPSFYQQRSIVFVTGTCAFSRSFSPLARPILNPPRYSVMFLFPFQEFYPLAFPLIYGIPLSIFAQTSTLRRPFSSLFFQGSKCTGSTWAVVDPPFPVRRSKPVGKFSVRFPAL